MDSARWDRMQSIFYDAAACPESAWQALLEDRCGDDEEVMAEVLGMLQADSRSASLLDRGLSDLAYRIASSPTDGASLQEFGPYRLTGEKLGEGGMGVVWLAQRKDAGNLVAIKFLIHAGLSPARRERFAREIKTLAKLKHPFIARLYDAGTLEGGTPWFVMEYVKGAQVTDYCRQPGRTIGDLLKLFRSICEAVRYAHGQEIIHRDLKPSNILVEADGTPRLLDFGIARELHGLEEPSDRTRPGLRMMTPQYAAPEWIEEGTVGFFTDVYSLGVILHEMLTAGKLAFPKSGAAWNDLSVLCLTAMHHDFKQRYQSVEALLRDIDHYLKGEPLEARPDSFRYRASKFITRNRRGLLAASLVLALVAGLVAAFTMRLARAHDAELAEAARTLRVEQFMLNLFDGGDKAAGPADDLRVATLLDRGVRDAQALNHDRAIQAELYQTLGGLYEKLGKFERAGSLLQSALDERKSVFGADSQQVAGSMVALGLLRVDQARLAEAEKLIQEALAMSRRHLQPGDSAPEEALSALGKVLAERGQYQEAIAVLNAAVRIQPAAANLSELADAHFYLGHYAIADSLYRQVLSRDEQTYGNRHPRVAEDFVSLGNVQTQWGHDAEAERYYRRALEIDQAWYGKDHPDSARMATYLAQAEAMQSRYPEASRLLEQALASMERAYGKVHPRVALVLNESGSVAVYLGKLSEGEADYGRTVEIYRSVYGDQHQMTTIALANLATVYLKQKQYARAEVIFRDVIQRFTKAQSADHLNTGIVRIKLGRTLVHEGRYREAEGEILAGYGIVKKQSSPSVSWLDAARQDLVTVYEALNEPEKAGELRAELAAVKTPGVVGGK